MKSPNNKNQVTKRFGVSQTIALIFSYPKPFLRLIDSSDSKDESVRKFGYSETEFNKLVIDFLASENIRSDEATRIKIAFSVDNLMQANLIVSRINSEKRIVLSDALIELLRLSDARLIKEISNIEYKGLLDELKRLAKELKHTTSIDGENYYDLKYQIFKHVRRIRNAIKNNELKFNQISERLAEISGGITDTDAKFSIAKREMYNQASKIYDRHIQPTVNFINANMRVKGGNLFDVLRGICTSFRIIEEFSAAEELEMYALNLSTAYKPLEKISADVKQFLSINRNSARAFNAFESISSILAESLEGTKSISLRNKELRKNIALQEAFDFYRYVDGSKGLSMQNSIRFNESPAFINSMKTEVEQLIELKSSVVSYQLEATNALSASEEEKKASDLNRARAFASFIDGMPLRETSDLYNLLHERLSGILKDYSFFDLNVAMKMITEGNLEKQNLLLKPTGYMEIMEIEDKLYQYRIRKLISNNKAKTQISEDPNNRD